MIGEHVENGNTEQTQNNTPNAKLEDIMIVGTSQEVSQETRQESEKWGVLRMSFCLGHHTILNMRNSRRKNPFFFFFFVEGGALWVCMDDDR
jgi:hypothetical protein